MAEPKFTPGPWVMRYDHNTGRYAMYGGEQKILLAMAMDQVPTDAEDVANAHLISKAPEMYELLEGLENDSGTIPAGYWKRIQDILAQARGEQ